MKNDQLNGLSINPGGDKGPFLTASTYNRAANTSAHMVFDLNANSGNVLRELADEADAAWSQFQAIKAIKDGAR